MLACLDRTIAELEDVVTKIQSMPQSDQLQEYPAVTNARFSRCHGLPSTTASHILGGKGVEESMQNCWLAASRTSPPRFESKAAFRSWLLRLLIDEALAVPNKNQSQFAAALIDDREPSLAITPF